MGTSANLVGALRRSWDVVAHPHASDRVAFRRLADEQAGLRRVATLVARGAAPAEVFEAVIAEVGRLVPADGAALSRYDADDALTTIGFWSRAEGYVPVGTRHSLDPGTVGRQVLDTRRPARTDSYTQTPGSLARTVRERGWRSSVGAPIIVQGRLWGVMGVASTTDRILPADTEARLAQFTELLATAVANVESREKLARLAEEQAALRRVATLVAKGASPSEVFEAVTGEAGRLIGADFAGLGRYETDGSAVVVGGWTSTGRSYLPIGTRIGSEEGTLAGLILANRGPARLDGYEGLTGAGARLMRGLGWRSAVGVPVVVEGRLWGFVGVASTTDRQPPPDTEERLEEFTELLATAIANAESRAELAASRARIAATADATRRRIERDLHDGAQQRLVALALELRAAQAAIPPELGGLRAELSHLVEGHARVLEELREMALGIHPGILAEGGLGPALKTLARRSPIPVELELRTAQRMPERVEVTAYYVVSEALTNAAKHAGASVVHVDVATADRMLRVTVSDDGVGGADPARGSGLLGLTDRAEAIGGTITLHSPLGSGTALRIELPLDGHGQELPGSAERGRNWG